MSKRILAVDDEPDVLTIIRTALSSEGFDVTTAANGLEAISEVANQIPDLMILDVMMPGMDGFEVLRKLKEDDATANIPVIMLTGVSERKKILEALDSGIEHYIIKPFDFDDLIIKVNEVFSNADPAV